MQNERNRKNKKERKQCIFKQTNKQSSNVKWKDTMSQSGRFFNVRK